MWVVGTEPLLSEEWQVLLTTVIPPAPYYSFVNKYKRMEISENETLCQSTKVYLSSDSKGFFNFKISMLVTK